LRSLAVFIAATLGISIFSSARAADTSCLGAWKLLSAAVAPWSGPPTKPDSTEMNALIGKTVTLLPKEITGPKVFACKGPHYKLSDFTADMLFQGELGEMHDSDKSKDPQKLAAALGFTGTTFKTLETGCEIDWHFVDPSTVEIGLDNYVYTLKKQ
jgi:hypothetical protein